MTPLLSRATLAFADTFHYFIIADFAYAFATIDIAAGHCRRFIAIAVSADAVLPLLRHFFHAMLSTLPFTRLYAALRHADADTLLRRCHATLIAAIITLFAADYCLLRHFSFAISLTPLLPLMHAAFADYADITLFRCRHFHYRFHFHADAAITPLLPLRFLFCHCHYAISAAMLPLPPY